MLETVQFNGDFTQFDKSTFVEIQGETISYLPNLEYPYDNATIYIKLENGHVIDIQLSNGGLYFEAGSLPIINPGYPLLGDIVKIHARYTLLDDSKIQKVYLHTQSVGTAWLTTPSPFRNFNYQKQRKHIAKSIRKIEKLTNIQEIRKNIATFIKDNVFLNAYHYNFNATIDEIEQINQIINTKINDPQERPLSLFDRLYEAEEINNVYDVNVYAMSVKEFYNFCLEIATGKKQPISNGSPDYHFRFLDRFYTKEQQQEILIRTIQHFYPEIIGKHLIFEDTVTKEYNSRELLDPNNIKSNKKYIFEQALGYLSDCMTTPKIASVYIDLTQNMYEKNFFRSDQTYRQVYSEFYIFDTMYRNIVETLKWKDQQIVAIIDDPTIKVYIQQIPQLCRLCAKLRRIGWTNDGRIDPGQECQKVIDLLLQVEEMNLIQ